MRAGRPQRRGPGHTALITGASGGIGYELALLFARDGYDLVLVARSHGTLVGVADRLGREHGISVRALCTDPTRPGAPQEIYSELSSASISVDVLVNNAGFGVRGPFAEGDLADELVVALTHLTGTGPSCEARHWSSPACGTGCWCSSSGSPHGRW